MSITDPWTPEEIAQLDHIDKTIAYIKDVIQKREEGDLEESVEKHLLTVIMQALGLLKLPGELAPTLESVSMLIQYLLASQ